MSNTKDKEPIEPKFCDGNCCNKTYTLETMNAKEFDELETKNKEKHKKDLSNLKGVSFDKLMYCYNDEAPKLHKKGDLKDGGTRQTYSTGAQKEDSSKTEGKGAYHLLPPTAIRRIAEIYRKGAIKYRDRNWELGIPLSRFLDSAKRHLDQYQEGMQDEDHLGQSVWNLLSLLHTEEMIERGILPEELDDLPNYMPTDANPNLWRKKRGKK